MRPSPELAGRRVPVVIAGGLLSVLLVVAGIVTGVRQHQDEGGDAGPAAVAVPTTGPAPFITALRTVPGAGDGNGGPTTTATTAPAVSASPVPTTAIGGDPSSPTVLPATPITPAPTAPPASPPPPPGSDPAASTGATPTVAPTATTGAGPPPSLPPAPAPPHTAALLGPPDRPALQQALATLRFPAWWPLPDAVATAPPLPTVQALHRGTGPGPANQVANDWATTWFLPGSDLDAVRQALVAQLPADVFAVEDPQTVSGQQGGARFTQLTFTLLPPPTTRTTGPVSPPVTSFTLLVYDAVTADGGQRVGAFVDESAEGSDAIPGAVTLDDSTVGWARSLPAADGLTLSGVDLSAARRTSTLDGSVRLRYDLPVANLPAAKAFYAEPANWTGSARPNAVLADTADGWSVPFAVAGTTGQLSASTANLGGVAAVTVELALAP